jgi:catechol 2,3-dioxygenase-like lactoylglutathione lyase family enzyme
MGDIGALHHTGLTVSSLDRSVAFYRDVLGFEVLAEQEKQGGYLAEIVGYPDVHVKMAHLRLPASDHRLELFEYVQPTGEAGAHEPRMVGPTHLCMLVDDLPSVHARLEDAGVEFFSRPVLVDTGINTGGYGVYLRDPDGIILELFQPPRR